MPSLVSGDRRTSSKPILENDVQKCHYLPVLLALGAIVAVGGVFLILAAQRVLPHSINAISQLGVGGLGAGSGIVACGVLLMAIGGVKCYLAGQHSTNESVPPQQEKPTPPQQTVAKEREEVPIQDFETFKKDRDLQAYVDLFQSSAWGYLARKQFKDLEKVIKVQKYIRGYLARTNIKKRQVAEAAAKNQSIEWTKKILTFANFDVSTMDVSDIENARNGTIEALLNICKKAITEVTVEELLKKNTLPTKQQWSKLEIEFSFDRQLDLSIIEENFTRGVIPTEETHCQKLHAFIGPEEWVNAFDDVKNKAIQRLVGLSSSKETWLVPLRVQMTYRLNCEEAGINSVVRTMIGFWGKVETF